MKLLENILNIYKSSLPFYSSTYSIEINDKESVFYLNAFQIRPGDDTIVCVTKKKIEKVTASDVAKIHFSRLSENAKCLIKSKFDAKEFEKDLSIEEYNRIIDSINTYSMDSFIKLNVGTFISPMDIRSDVLTSFTYKGNINNCGAILIMNPTVNGFYTKGLYELGIKSIKCICLNKEKKSMAIYTDRVGGALDRMADYANENKSIGVSIKKTVPSKNMNSGNKIYSGYFYFS